MASKPVSISEQPALQPEQHRYAFDGYDLAAFLPVARRFGHERYGYVVTPNVDHLARLEQKPNLAAPYNRASFVLLDSRLLSLLLRAWRRLSIPTCTGSDLTAQLLATAVSPDDGVVLIGCSEAQAIELAQNHRLNRLAHYNPPMGFINDAAEVERCLWFIEAHSPFRYCLLAVGSPQQEIIAAQLLERGRARGLALCIGASINFLTGGEKRAPRWMQSMGIEWAWRILQDPQRLLMRYVRAVPPLLRLLRRGTFSVRENSAISAPPTA